MFLLLMIFPAKWLGYSKVIKGLTQVLLHKIFLHLQVYRGYDPEVGAYVGTGS